MATKKGFDFSSVTKQIEAHEVTKGYEEIEMGLIDRNKKNFYPVETKSVKNLADSIAEHGLLQPVVVLKHEDTGRYTLVAGERRYSAFLLLGKEKIPAKVKNASDVSKIDEEIMLIQTNSTARELTNEIKLKQAKRLEELYAQKRAQKDPSLRGVKTVDALAGDLNVSISTAKRMRRLNKDLIEPFLEAINKNEMTMGVGLDIVKHFDAEAQRQLYEEWKATGKPIKILVELKQTETADEFSIPIIDEKPTDKATADFISETPLASSSMTAVVPEPEAIKEEPPEVEDMTITAFNSAIQTIYNKMVSQQGAVNIDQIDFQTLEMVYAILTSEKEKEKDKPVKGQLSVEDAPGKEKKTTRFNTKRSLKAETDA